jgi:hypothetical protein
MSHWMLTRTGREVYLSGPEAQAAQNVPDLAEIGHSLAQINRFTGHASRPYSVAEHSLLVHSIACTLTEDPLTRFAALMHDAHECITGDVATPIKRAVGAAWDTFEAYHAGMLAKHYGIDNLGSEIEGLIKHCDLVALATERRDLMEFALGMQQPWPILDSPKSKVLPLTNIWLASEYLCNTPWRNWAAKFFVKASDYVGELQLHTAGEVVV